MNPFILTWILHLHSKMKIKPQIQTKYKMIARQILMAVNNPHHHAGAEAERFTNTKDDIVAEYSRVQQRQ
jgi:hypothetical protein